VLFDTSALVTRVVYQRPNHEAALACFRRLTLSGREKHIAVCSTYALAECYATLTALHAQCAARQACVRIITYKTPILSG
jgi:predicted nucleic acid-binding protein